MSLSQELCPTLNHFLGLNIPGVRSQRNGGLCSPVAPPMPPTLNISSPASHSYENLPFWSCFLLILRSWLLVPSFAPLSSLPLHPSSHAPVQSGLMFSHSGCSLPVSTIKSFFSTTPWSSHALFFTALVLPKPS